jgi:hypothetical protein
MFGVMVVDVVVLPSLPKLPTYAAEKRLKASYQRERSKHRASKETNLKRGLLFNWRTGTPAKSCRCGRTCRLTCAMPPWPMDNSIRRVPA